MTTARDIIRLVFQSLETDIEHAQWAIENADAESKRTIEDQKLCEASGKGILVAEATYNWQLGFYHGITFENEHRIEALKRRLDYWKSLDERCAEEEMLEKAEEDEEEDEDFIADIEWEEDEE